MVYCKECKYLINGESNGSCTYPDNVCTISSWYDSCCGYSQEPSAINADNDCAWFAQKEK